MCSSKFCPADPLAVGTIQILYLMSYGKLCAREQASGGQYENAMAEPNAVNQQTDLQCSCVMMTAAKRLIRPTIASESEAEKQ
jgi:hypothetical protein